MHRATQIFAILVAEDGNSLGWACAIAKGVHGAQPVCRVELEHECIIESSIGIEIGSE